MKNIKDIFKNTVEGHHKVTGRKETPEYVIKYSDAKILR